MQQWRDPIRIWKAWRLVHRFLNPVVEGQCFAEIVWRHQEPAIIKRMRKSDGESPNLSVVTDGLRIQRRTCIESSSCSNPSRILLDPPIDPIPPPPSSGTTSDSVANQVDVNLPFHLVASQRILSIPRTEGVADIKEPLVADFSSVFSYILRDYDPNARHFDGLTGVRSEDILIDLNTDSMER